MGLTYVCSPLSAPTRAEMLANTCTWDPGIRLAVWGLTQIGHARKSA